MITPEVRSPLTWAAAPLERVLVLGCPGAGKTSFARTLGRETALPVFHLDDHYWGPGWSRTDPEEWIAWQHDLVRRKCWLIDGHYMSTVPLRLPHADLVLLVDAPAVTCLRRTILRAWLIRRGQQQLLPARVREGARAGDRVPATKDLGALLVKILRFRRRDFKELIRLAASTPRTHWVAAVVPGPFGIRDRVAGHPARGRHGWTVLPLPTATCFVVETIQAGRVPGRGTADRARGRSPARQPRDAENRSQSGDER